VRSTTKVGPTTAGKSVQVRSCCRAATSATDETFIHVFFRIDAQRGKGHRHPYHIFTRVSLVHRTVSLSATVFKSSWSDQGPTTVIIHRHHSTMPYILITVSTITVMGPVVGGPYAFHLIFNCCVRMCFLVVTWIVACRQPGPQFVGTSTQIQRLWLRSGRR
jgi:hypothetical protein